MANYMNRKRDGAGAKLPKRMITRPRVPVLDAPDIDMRSVKQIYKDHKAELVKPTTQAERRRIYARDRKAAARKAFTGLTVEQRLIALEAESNNRVNSIAHINARIDWIPKMETHLKLLTQRVWALENEIHHITPAKQEDRDLMRSFANDVKTRVPPIPAVNNEAARSIYEIQKLLTNAVNALEQIRK